MVTNDMRSLSVGRIPSNKKFFETVI